MEGHIVLFCLSFRHSLKNCSLDCNVCQWILNARTLNSNSPEWSLTNKFDHVTLVFDPLIENFNLGYIFWIVSTRTSIFHMSIPCENILDTVTVWPTLKMNLGLNFWVAKIWLRYLTWVYIMTKAFCRYHKFLPCDLDLGVWPTLSKTFSQ
jgi:hypothetical protein